MADAKVNEQLAEHLDQAVMGSPKSPALMGIIEVLFSEEEVEIALRLPFQNKTLSELKEMFSDRPDIEDILNRMVKRGMVFTGQSPGQEQKYFVMG